MDAPRRIFLTFAAQDAKYRDLVIMKAKKERVSCSFVETSLKAPGDQLWQNHCRSKMKGCDGVIALVSEHTGGADAVLWEIRCACTEKLPILGVYVDLTRHPQKLPAELDGVPLIMWKWDAIAAFLETAKADVRASSLAIAGDHAADSSR